MRRTADLVVVGAGIAGASSAYYAACAGLRVAVVDRGAPAGGATGAAAANIRCHHTNPLEARFALEGRELFRRWSDTVGGDCGFHEIGGLFIVGPEEAARLRRNVEMLRAIGVNTTALDAQALRELQPFMATEDVGAAAYEPESGYVDASLAVSGMLDRAKERGAWFLFNQPSVHILLDGKGVAGVRAGADEILAPNVVLAAGPGARGLVREIGVDLPVFPYPIGAGTLRRPPSVGPVMAVIDRAIGLWYRADLDDLMILEAGYEDLTLLDTASLEQYVEALPPSPEDLIDAGGRLSTRIPAIAEAIPGRTWAAIDSCTPDGHAIVGPVPAVPGLYLLAGANGVFVRLAPPFARALVETITTGHFEDSRIAPFGLDRFASGRSLQVEDAYGLGSFS